MIGKAMDVLGRVALDVWHTFLHNWPFLLISVVVAAVLTVYVGTDRLSAALRRRTAVAVVGAVVLASVTPFCSCGTTAVVLGALATSVPWAPVVSFMVSSPLTSPEEYVYSTGLFGLNFATTFFFAAIVLGLAAGALTYAIERTGWLNGQARMAPAESARAASASSCCAPAEASGEAAAASSCCTPAEQKAESAAEPGCCGGSSARQPEPEPVAVAVAEAGCCSDTKGVTVPVPVAVPATVAVAGTSCCAADTKAAPAPVPVTLTAAETSCCAPSGSGTSTDLGPTIHVGAGTGTGVATGPAAVSAAVSGAGAGTTVLTKPAPAPAPAHPAPSLVTEYKLDELGRTLWQNTRRLAVYFFGFAALGYLLIEAVPTAFLTEYLGGDSPFAVPLAALIGIPVYLNSDGSLPLVASLMNGGMGAGPALAFLVTGAGTSVGAISGMFVIARKKVVGLVVGSLFTGALLLGWAAPFWL